MIVEQKDHEYSDIVCEYLSIELKFTKNERYVISENSFISQTMWMKV